jgi:hypothetical protein
VPGDFRIDQLGAQRLEAAECAFLVCLDQPRIARDIGRQDRREPTFDPLSAHDFLPRASHARL